MVLPGQPCRDRPCPGPCHRPSRLAPSPLRTSPGPCLGPCWPCLQNLPCPVPCPEGPGKIICLAKRVPSKLIRRYSITVRKCHLGPSSGVRAGPGVYLAPSRVAWSTTRVAPWIASTFPRSVETLLVGVTAGWRIVVGPIIVLVTMSLVIIVDVCFYPGSFSFYRHLEPRPAVRRAVAGLPRLDPGWERLQSQDDQVKVKMIRMIKST